MDTFQLAVAHDLGIGVIDLQRAKQGDEGSSLFWGTRIGSVAFLIKPTFIADTDGMGVVVPGMHADFCFVTGLIELAIAFNVVVIADAFAMETGVMAVAKHVDREALVAAGRRAMNYNQIYCTHFFFMSHRNHGNHRNNPSD